MKKFFLAIPILAVLSILSLPLCSAAPPLTSAASAVLIDGTNGRVLYEKNAHVKRAPASTTKIMTTCLALELGNLDDIVTVSPYAAKVGGSSMYLSPNEKVKLEDLLYGIMLNSGNDASAAVGEHLAGNSLNFAKLMTEKAWQIQAKNTQFKNPHGLDEDGHFTTAYDLALITKYAMENPKFREIIKTKTFKVPWEGREYERLLTNKNKLLSQFPGANGVKTGFTNKAGRCLVSSAERDGQHLIAVVFNCPNMWDDSKNLLEYGFDNYKPHTLLRKGEIVKTVQVSGGLKKELRLAAKEDLTIFLKPEEISQITPPMIEIPEQISAPIVKGQSLGYVKLIYQEKQLGKIALVATENIEQQPYLKTFSNSMFSLIINLVKIFY